MFKIDFIYLTDLTMDDLLVKTARLPENTVGFYALTLMDRIGKEFIPQKQEQKQKRLEK